MNDRIELDEAYMQMAEIWSLRSKAIRKKTGAIIVKDRQIISDGYNGMPAGTKDDCCELKNSNGEFVKADGELITNPLVLHAESNALMKLVANGGTGSAGATLYCTLSPCQDCVKLILQAKIARVVYREIYRIPTGIDILKEYCVICEHLPK